jgi:hypothetical protein
MPPQDYWSQVPGDMLPRLHFYNIPVTIDAAHAANPFNIIKSVYQPGDFVVSGTHRPPQLPSQALDRKAPCCVGLGGGAGSPHWAGTCQHFLLGISPDPAWHAKARKHFVQF